jgi:hypothetical protein
MKKFDHNHKPLKSIFGSNAKMCHSPEMNLKTTVVFFQVVYKLGKYSMVNPLSRQLDVPMIMKDFMEREYTVCRRVESVVPTAMKIQTIQ